MIDIISVEDLIKLDLEIPNYQRPYKWQSKNIFDLLQDIDNIVSIPATAKDGEHKYRIGTIILYSNPETKNFDIIDGQQRIISLLLIKLYLDPTFFCPLMNKAVSNKITQKNMHNNYECIKMWFSAKSEEYKRQVNDMFTSVLEVVKLVVESLPSAFQLFDSQNTRGKSLDPHDLLKAYHLREMRGKPYEMFHAVTRWESFKPEDIKTLFDIYLYAILNWANKEKTQPFTVNKIDHYKGISEFSDYTYAKRAKKAEPYFQITEPFTAGSDFFHMVDHYLVLISDIATELGSNDAFSDIFSIINNKKYNKSMGFKYCVSLFKCAILCYYDKFHNFDERAIKKLFVWSFMLRVDMKNLGFDSVNKYASGNDGFGKYSNVIPIFSLIAKSRFHSEISNLILNVKREHNLSADKNWTDLYEYLKLVMEGR